MKGLGGKRERGRNGKIIKGIEAKKVGVDNFFLDMVYLGLGSI